jgi:hypothetical protein
MSLSNLPSDANENHQPTRDGLAQDDARDKQLESLAVPHLPKVRACHDLADLLKRTRPKARGQIEELEGIVTRSHQSLEGATSQNAVSEALSDIEGAYQAPSGAKAQSSLVFVIHTVSQVVESKQVGLTNIHRRRTLLFTPKGAEHSTINSSQVTCQLCTCIIVTMMLYGVAIAIIAILRVGPTTNGAICIKAA